MLKITSEFKALVDARMSVVGMGQQTELAEKLEIATPTLSRMLTTGDPRFSTIKRIAKALGCEAWELLRPAGAEGTPLRPATPLESLAQVLAHLDADPRVVALVAGWENLSEPEREMIFSASGLSIPSVLSKRRSARE